MTPSQQPPAMTAYAQENEVKIIGALTKLGLLALTAFHSKGKSSVYNLPIGQEVLVAGPVHF